MLALTSPTGGGRSVGIVRSRTKATEFSLWMASCLLVGLRLSLNPTSRPDATHREWQITEQFFSWWWAHGCPKYVEKRNKCIKQNCAPSWTYLRDATTKFRVFRWQRAREKTSAWTSKCCVLCRHTDCRHSVQL